MSEAGEGEFRLLRIEGQPGIGKSRLLDELATKAEAEDWLVLRGSAAEFESELPFGPVIDALDAYLMALDPRAVNRLGPETAATLAEVFPSLVSYRSEGRPPAIASERFRIHHAIRELLERLSGRSPLALILDDLQWADQASLELIGHLLRRQPQGGILLAMAHRRGSLDPTLATTLLDPSGPVTDLAVGPLDEEQTSRLLGESESRSQEIYKETGGNPFYVLELKRAGISPSSGQTVPDAIAKAIATEVSGLGLHARRFIEAAAVVGDPFDIDLTSLILGDDHPVPDSIDELTGSGLIKPTEVPRRFAFRHPLVRSAIYESALPGTRLADHEQAARSLAASSAPATSQARHLVLSARPGDVDSARTIATGAAETLASAPRLSAEWCDAALRVMPDGHPTFQGRVLGTRAAAAAAMSRFDLARDSLLAAIDLLPEDDLKGRSTLTGAVAAIEELLGQHSAAHARLTSLLSELEDQGSEQAIEVMFSLAYDGFLRLDTEQMTVWSKRALDASIEHGDPEYIATAQATRALCASFTGPIEESRTCADAAAAAFAGFNDAEIDFNVDWIVRLATAELYLERFEDVLAHTEIALVASRRTGQGQNFPAIYPCIGTAGITLGQFEVAREALDNAIDGARLSDNKHSLAWSLFNRSALALAQGDLELADELSAESLGLLADHEDGLVKTWSGVMRASVLDAMGQREEGLKLVAEAGGGEDLSNLPGSWRVGFLLMEVEALVALDRIEDAERICLIAEARAEEFGNAMARSHALRARSVVAFARGDFDTAIRTSEEAIESSDSVGAIIESGVSRMALAQAQEGSGDRDSALAELDLALAVFEERGARRWQGLCEQKLRSMGKKIHRRTAAGVGESGVDSLTQREREVADLVLDRRTNREIAETLFLSQKTVETHLRNIFAKLGVSSRVEVARMLEQQAG